ncbi:MAG: HEAT repeat domain-containing protein [Planctomycetota bacterium]|nr:HEAT repeat domain-containing protein [Planctomycetota bacterium]
MLTQNSKYKIMLLLIGSHLLGLPLLGAEDPWLLFRRCDQVLHGTVVELIGGERDRLYHITTDDQRNASRQSWWLREPEGEGAEGIGALTGQRGMWMVVAEVEGEFSTADATVLPGGYLQVKDTSVLQPLQQLLQADCDPSIALTLMSATDDVVRQIAIGWWRTHGPDPDAHQAQNIESAFGRESAPAVQRSFLELYLQRNLHFAEPGLADLIPRSQDPAVAMLTTQYLKSHGTVRQRARLVSAWPGSDLTGKKRLAQAYRILSIVEASPWLLQGVTSEHPSLRWRCIESLASCIPDESRNILQSLMLSTNQEIRTATMFGLARSRVPGAWQLLRQTIDNFDESDPLLPLATQLRKHPWKVLKSRGSR